MAAADDFLHTGALLEALVAQVKAEVPEAWRTPGTPDYVQSVHCIGSVYEYWTRSDTIAGDCPAILFRPIRVRAENEGVSLGGARATVDVLRVVYVRTCRQATDATGKPSTIYAAKVRCAKALLPALFADRRLAGAELSTSSTRADVRAVRFTGLDYEGTTPDVRAVEALGSDVWAFAVDVEIETHTGGR